MSSALNPDDIGPLKADALLKRYGVKAKIYRFRIEDGEGGNFKVDGNGMTAEDALDNLVTDGVLSVADRDYVVGYEEINDR